MTGRPLTALFMPESAYGPTNNCIGVGDVLRRRGHHVVFAAEASWRGRLEPLGFTEDLVDLAPPAAAAQDSTAQRSTAQDSTAQRSTAQDSTAADSTGRDDAGQFWKEFIASTAPEFRKPTIEQLETWIKPVWTELISGARYCQSQLSEIIDRVRPDVIIEDNVISFPALMTAKAPFVRMVSCNPLEMTDPGLPPAFSGYPAASDVGRAEFRAEYERVHRDLWAEFSAWVAEQGAPPLPDLEFIHEGALNLYVYPELADYPRTRPLPPSWHRLDSSVRQTDATFALPQPLASGNGSLVYFSLGSLGSADVALMRRIIDCLAATPHRYIVSAGPLHAEIDLAPNMWGAEFLPQTSIIPMADLVITHGGNNTTTECLHFGKPMVVLPLFWDQHDNAQRMDELGLGVRLNTYGFSDAQLHSSLELLLSDAALHQRLAEGSARIRNRDGLRTAADLIERAAYLSR